MDEELKEILAGMQGSLDILVSGLDSLTADVRGLTSAVTVLRRDVRGIREDMTVSMATADLAVRRVNTLRAETQETAEGTAEMVRLLHRRLIALEAKVG